MSKFSVLLLNAYENAYDLNTKHDYTEPVIYDAGGDLSKRWYVYFSFRNPVTQKLERQTPIYAKVNRFKKLTERREAITNLRKAISNILKDGYNPYDSSEEDNPIEVHTTDNTPIPSPEVINQLKDDANKYSITDAVKFALKIRKATLKPNSYSDFKTRVQNFEEWLSKNDFEGKNINDVSQKVVINFLNDKLMETSPSNRNNTRGVLFMFFKTLKKNEIIKHNFIEEIEILKSTPERNKTYSLKQEKDIYEILEKTDPLMFLFIKFVSYNYLRPVEVVRLKIRDINIAEKLIYVRAKNKPVKTKIIPQILLDQLPDLEKFDGESYLFTPTGMGKEWDTDETNKRNYFGKRFKKVKEQLKLGKDYGMYSFRHTFITKLYKELVKNSTPFEAKSRLMLITGHTTMDALEKYLRDIDAVLPEDYSDLLKKKV